MGVYHINDKENEPRTRNNSKADSKRENAKNTINGMSILLQAPLTPTATRVPRIKMNNGQEIPAFGLGTSTSNHGETKQTVKNAIDAGYRHIDCAYNQLNEAEIGEAIKVKIDEGVIKRKDLFIVSKLWNPLNHPDHVEVGLRKTLDALGVEYLDLFLIHWPSEFKEGGYRFPILTRDGNAKVIFSDVDICETWRAMEQLVQQGFVKSIGVSNFNCEQLVRILSSATIRPAVNQIEIHPYERQRKLIDFCKVNGIVVMAYSPLEQSDRQWEREPTYLQVPNLLDISQKYKKSVPQIMLRWAIQRGVVVIPKSKDRASIVEYLNIFDFYLTEEEMEDIFVVNSISRSNSLSK